MDIRTRDEEEVRGIEVGVAEVEAGSGSDRLEDRDAQILIDALSDPLTLDEIFEKSCQQMNKLLAMDLYRNYSSPDGFLKKLRSERLVTYSGGTELRCPLDYGTQNTKSGD
jgi:hypothetical protein